jgi:hypothetical protein
LTGSIERERHSLLPKAEESMTILHSFLEEILASPAMNAVHATLQGCKTLPVYRLHLPDRGDVENEAHRWARALFVDCKHFDPHAQATQHDNRLVLRHPDGLRVRAYYASGTVEYRHLGRAYAGTTEIVDMCDAEAVVARFADRHGLWPLDSTGQLQAKDFQLVQSRGMNPQCLEAEITTHNAIIGYQRITSGIPWIGPGSRVLAIIEQDEVVGFDRSWRPVIPGAVGSVAVTPAEQAVGAMLDAIAMRAGGRPIECGAIRLERAEFGYYAMDKRAEQRFLQPAYQFFYRTSGEIAAGVVEVIAAHGEAIEPLVEPPSLAPHGRRTVC